MDDLTLILCSAEEKLLLVLAKEQAETAVIKNRTTTEKNIPSIKKDAPTIELSSANTENNSASAEAKSTTKPQALQSVHFSKWNVPKQGIRILLPTLEHALNIIKAQPDSIKRIACVVGPGSFTGLRLSISTAQAIALAGNIPLGAIKYLPLLAQNAPKANNSFWVITYCRVNYVYAQSFSALDKTPLTEVAVYALEELTELIDKDALLFGSGIVKNAAFFEKTTQKKSWQILPPHYNDPSEKGLLDCAKKCEYSFDQLLPYYLRPADAEENLEYIAKLRGIEFEEAQILLKSAYENL